MITIHKYLINITDSQVIPIPSGSKIIKVDLDGHNRPSIWAIVDTEESKVHRTFCVFGTGHPLPDDICIVYNYIGTFVEQPFVWHVFEKIV